MGRSNLKIVAVDGMDDEAIRAADPQSRNKRVYFTPDGIAFG